MDVNFQSYEWKGINKQGKRLSGVIRATGIKTVESELQSREIDVISIVIKKQFTLTSLRKKISTKNIWFFTRYLSTMLSAGMPILKALEIISQDPDNKAMQSIVVLIRNDISSGKTLSEAIAKYPAYFNPLYCNLIKAGEKSGTLDKILKSLASYIEKTEMLRKKVKKALVYPCAIVAVALIVGLILLIFVLPQFETMFQSYGVQLPLFTRMFIDVSNFTRSYWWLLLLIIIGLVWGVKTLLRNNERFAQLKDIGMLKLYILGPLMQKTIIARFTSTLAITYDAGLPIIDAMQSMINIVGNRVYSRGVKEICDEIIAGNPLSSAMNHTHLFPNMVIQMVSVGEASGVLPEMLSNIARYYEEEVNSIVDNLSTLLEPMIIVMLGVIIGSFVIAMYLPIFKLGKLF